MQLRLERFYNTTAFLGAAEGRIEDGNLECAYVSTAHYIYVVFHACWSHKVQVERVAALHLHESREPAQLHQDERAAAQGTH